MNQIVEDLLEQLVTGKDHDELQRLVGLSLHEIDPTDLCDLMTAMAGRAQRGQLRTSAHGWHLVVAALSRRLRETATISPGISRAIGSLYRSLGPDFPHRHELLTILSSSLDENSLQVFATLIADDPPRGLAEAVAPLLPLFSVNTPVTAVFPQLLDALRHATLAPAVLDLANYLVRNGVCDGHPAASRASELIHLLQGVTRELEQLQDQALAIPTGPSNSQQTVEQTVGLGIGLAISLCDALALIGQPSARGPLAALLELRHRRLRVEAAAALARLGDQQGEQSLVELAREPVVRLRVLHYAEELGIAESIPDEYRSDVAIAEAELVAHLAEPTTIGTPPSRCELVDTRTLFWPGYEEPRNCYLFRYTYTVLSESGTAHCLSNVGIAGPVAHSVNADVGELPVEDTYALFAGWHADHESIRETSVTDDLPLTNGLHSQFHNYVARLSQEEFEAVEPVTLGEFFGEETLVARAERRGDIGVAVVDQNSVLWQPTVGLRPLSPADVYCIYKGRRLLEAFN